MKIKKYKRKIIFIILLLIIITGYFVISSFFQKKVPVLHNYEPYYSREILLEPYYSMCLKEWNEFENSNEEIIITPDTYIVENEQIISSENSYGYHSSVVKVDYNGKIEFILKDYVPGVYNIKLDYNYTGNDILPIRIGILINDEYQYYEARQINLPIKWYLDANDKSEEKNTYYQFKKDRYGNDIQPKSVTEAIWHTDYVYDNSYYYSEPLKFRLIGNEAKITIVSYSNDLLIGDVHLVTPQKLTTYEEYIALYQDKEKIQDLLTVEAEFINTKSDPSIKLGSDNNITSTPYDAKYSLLNSIDIWTWNTPGQRISWKIKIDKSGLYRISFKYIQNQLLELPSFRRIDVDGVVPFAELANYPFQYTDVWKNETLNKDGEPFYIFLNEGTHEIGMTAVMDVYRPVVETYQSIMRDINQLAMDIKKVTAGGTADIDRDWDIEKYIPDIVPILQSMYDELDKTYRYLNSLNNQSKEALDVKNVVLAMEKLESLIEKPNKITLRMNRLSEGSSSAAQLLGDMLLKLTKQPLGLEKLYVHGNVQLPKTKASIFANFWVLLKKFFLTFITKDYTDIVKYNDEDTITIWVNRPRMYLELMQKMIDEEFTPNTGIKVNLSLMPDTSKLILANAAGKQPDLALGLASSMAYEFAIRGAAVNFREFEGYEDIVSNFAKGAMIPYVYDEGVYGLPETQNFYLTFYRTDILNKLNIKVPDTWDEVKEILPELHRYGMNYYIPLAYDSSYKNFSVTLPFYYQYGANIYSSNGMEATIDSEESIEAMKLMTSLFTTHSLPKQVSSFYNSFRYGTIPIGVSNSETYLRLLIAAPEIKANWAIGLYPGIEDENGEIVRYAPTQTSCVMMFHSSDKKEKKAFEFIKWWLDTNTQKQFAYDLQSMYGKEYIWFSANINAFKSLPIAEEDKNTILKQWEWAMEAPNVPGSYMMEREISMVWNAVVLENGVVRDEIDRAIININRELKRKLTEFGYLKDGVMIKEFKVPTIQNIDYWLTETGGKRNEE